jgi:hypothetical protein
MYVSYLVTRLQDKIIISMRMSIDIGYFVTTSTKSSTGSTVLPLPPCYSDYLRASTLARYHVSLMGTSVNLDQGTSLSLIFSGPSSGPFRDKSCILSAADAPTTEPSCARGRTPLHYLHWGICTYSQPLSLTDKDS